jgi:hypothetical protein
MCFDLAFKVDTLPIKFESMFMHSKFGVWTLNPYKQYDITPITKQYFILMGVDFFFGVNLHLKPNTYYFSWGTMGTNIQS